MDNTEPEVPLGPRVIASLVAVATAVLPIFADFNETHIYNPLWTGHAKFHSAQTMALGVALGLLALVYVWRRGRFVDGLVVAGLYWLTQALALAFPGTVLFDPGFEPAKVGGLQPSQLWGDAAVMVLLTIAYAGSRRAR